MEREHAIYATLKASRLRRTPVRIGVLSVLEKSPHPVAVSEILAHLPEHTDAVTVYRTLNTFSRLHLVHRIRGEDREWRYALGGTPQKKQHQHPHFVCEDCGNVECLKESEVPHNLVHTLQVAKDYKVNYYEVVLHGLCPRCR